MALRLIGLAIKKQPAIIKSIQIGSIAPLNTLNKIGNREFVGYGINGSGCYVDKVEFPMPSIRFREETPEICELRQKEKGDWKELTMCEKKLLYRHSFCQTFSEMLANTGEWKMNIGVALMIISAGILMVMVTNIMIYPEIPHSFSEESQKAQLKRILDLEMNPVTGISSKWDYENKKWK